MFAYLAFGTLFGFILSRIGATQFDTIAQMFLLEDLHLAGVIGIAIALTAPALFVLRRRGIAGPNDCQITLTPKPRKAGNIVGGILFGVGWALTGTCPGTALSQLGEGRVLALFTLAGIFAGVALYRITGDRMRRWLSPRKRSDAGDDGVEGSARPHVLVG